MKDTVDRLYGILTKFSSYTPLTYLNIVSGLLNGVLKELTKERPVLLDVGCGRGIMQDLLKLRRQIYSIGVDLFKPSLKEAKSKRRYDDVVLADARYLPFKEKAFNITMALHFIEHLSKSDGFKVIKNLEKLSKHFILFVTPPAHMHIDIVDGNPYQFHLSSWLPYEMRVLGYDVKGLWLKIIWGDRGIAKKLPLPLQKIVILINYLFAPLSYLFPEIAGCIIAYKKLQVKRGKKECTQKEITMS